ncbi:MAG: tetratricopeptide repeat protein, partial [Pseudomonadota bacterium]
MLKQIVTASCCAVAVWLALPFAAGLGVGSGAAFAQEEEEQQRETRRIPSMSESAYKQLSEAQEAVDEENWAGALEVLEKMLENEDRLNGNELGQVHNMLGFVHFSQENYQEAIDAYEVVLEQGENIPEGLEVQTYYTLA